MLRITTACASLKRIGKAKFAELAKHAVAVTAGHQAQLVAAAHGGKDLKSASDQLCTESLILFTSRRVSVEEEPISAEWGDVDVVPVRGVMLAELVQTPDDSHFVEHRQVGGGIGVEGIEQSAVPIEEDAFDLVFRFVFPGGGHEPSTSQSQGIKSKNLG